MPLDDDAFNEVLSGLFAAATADEVRAAFENLESLDDDDLVSVLRAAEMVLLQDLPEPPLSTEQMQRLHDYIPAQIREIRAGGLEAQALGELQAEALRIICVATLNGDATSPLLSAYADELTSLADEDYNTLEGLYGALVRTYEKLSPPSASPAPKSTPKPPQL